ncbi:nucleotidyl transferase AbiEii/AbiGii toxin family protein [Oscillatoria laete-virens NRMC-F 0139]|nr:nucleotidyl transferase AbiEii/AbiGii toxin family protein [Oscillatoria laete-virens]MDL5055263.1 nucleotidyl transferase AbiEii/AbiGii toxin family protein [Oscillatoria laete-virens NRMC-F 0139]
MSLGLLERMAYALELLGRLVDAGMDPIFKGGTSLILRLKQIRRLSIDVDIVCSMPQAKLNAILGQIGNKPPFLDWEEHVRRKDGLPKRKHYKFFFHSVVENKRLPILLDVLFEENPYGDLEEVSLENPFLPLEHPVKVKVPTVDQLLGDKLTAFAPNTVGVLFNPESTMQIAKQLFDISQLFEEAHDLSSVAATYDRLCADQIRYRGHKHSRAEALDDTFELCREFSMRGLPKVKESKQAQMLWDGIQKLADHLIDTEFRNEEARTAVARTAYLVHLLKTEACQGKLKHLRYTREKEKTLVENQIGAPYGAMNRLIEINPEAYYYWSRILVGSSEPQQTKALRKI